MELDDRTLTMNDGLDGVAQFISLIFLARRRACFEKHFTGLRLPLLLPTWDSMEAF